jgi:terminase large subunit-like protein
MPHPGQRAVRREARRFNWLSAGRRWRKTTHAMSIAVEAALRGQQIIWGAPVYDQTRVCMDETRRALGGVAEFNTQRMSATLPTGGSILYRSLDNPDNVRSHTADGVVIDEAGDVKRSAWYEVLRPMLIDTGGWLWAIGTPKGHNWFWEEFMKAPDRGDSSAWQVPTVGCRIEGGKLIRVPHALENPHIDFAEIVALWETQPEATFRQEILAEFLQGEGSVFRKVREAIRSGYACYSGEYVAGLDWAKQHDFTVIVVIDKPSRRVVDIDRFNKVDWSLQRGRVRAMHEKWGLSAIWAEANSIGGPNIEALQAEGLPVIPFETTATSKPPLIQSLALAFEKDEIGIPRHEVMIGELEAYEQKASAATGRPTYNAPEGLHDDCVIALALAWQGCVNPGEIRFSDDNPFYRGGYDAA